jgi:hypothetical protein
MAERWYRTPYSVQIAMKLDLTRGEKIQCSKNVIAQADPSMAINSETILHYNNNSSKSCSRG